MVASNKTFSSDLKEGGDLRYLREIKVKLDYIQINLKVWLGKHPNDRLDHTCDRKSLNWLITNPNTYEPSIKSER